MNTNHIAFNKPSVVGEELTFILQAITSAQLSGAGPFTRQCELLLEQQLQVHRAMLTTSCTDALEMCALLLDLQPGDEVILPSFTFVSTANAFALRGARPVFVDIRPDTLNLDEHLLLDRITPRTRAIVVVHYAGVGCEMEPILAIADRFGIPVVEDNAHGVFGRYRGRSLGSIGQLATLSFHDTKNFTCGEGGALLINEPAYVERADIIVQKGTNRSRFVRGEMDKYTWIALGSSFRPSDMLAAFLLAQLEAHQTIQTKRQHIWNYYQAHLKDWADAHGVVLPTVPSHCDQAYHMFYLLLPSLADRQAMIAHLKVREISSAFHYLPLHLSPMGQSFGGKPGDFPVTEDISDRLLRLPFFNSMTDAELSRVVSAVLEFNAWSTNSSQPHAPVSALERAA